jgi:hypothetical protein
MFSPPETGDKDLDAFLYQVYLQSSSSDVATNITEPGSGQPIQFPFQYLYIKFANNYLGSGISDSSVGKTYWGVANSNSPVESITPTSYIWTEQVGGFIGKDVFYINLGSRIVRFYIGATPPNPKWIADPILSIDLDVVVLADTIITGDLVDLAVTSDKLDVVAISSVTGLLNTNAVDTLQIVDLSVTTGKLDNLSVTTNKLNDLSVTTNKLNDLSVTTGKLDNLSVTTGKLDNLSVTTGKLNDFSVTTGKLDNLAITTSIIADAAVTQAQLKTKAVVTLLDADAVLTGTQLIDSSIFTITPTVARVLTTDTAANIVAALPRYQVGTWFDFIVVNLAAFNVTLAAGTGVTLVGIEIINNVSGTWKVRVDSATTITIYRG